MRQVRAPSAEFNIVERIPEKPRDTTFRVLIAVHRPRFRGRAQRAAALVGWQVTALLNKQDAVGAVSKGTRPPDIFILSGDFGRQRDYAIFRAVQPWREKGMKLIGLVDDARTAPEGHPESAPNRLCDVCLEPPYKTAELRALFAGLYTEIRHEPAPPPTHKSADESEYEADDEENDETDPEV